MEIQYRSLFALGALHDGGIASASLVGICIGRWNGNGKIAFGLFIKVFILCYSCVVHLEVSKCGEKGDG